MGFMIKNIPNILTVARMALIPVLIATFYCDGVIAHYVATGIFIFASLTDYMDGSIAKKFGWQSRFGKIFDPIADKMLVVSTLVMLVDKCDVPILPILAILCREVFISGVREYLAAEEMPMQVNNLGKVKTVIQMVAITILLLGRGGARFEYAHQIGVVAIYIAAVMTLISGYVYVRSGIGGVRGN